MNSKNREKEFLELVDKHQNIVHKICHIYTDNPDDHADLFQEILLQLWKGYTRFKGDSKFTTWMYRVGLYTSLSSLKKKHRRSDEAEVTEPLVNEEDPYQYEHLHTAISLLSETDKAMVMLYLEEKPYKEISEIMGISESNVGVKINRIKKKLKTLLTPK